ncbi:hypothetical protein [Nocardiopsis dassonvillei]|uniref:hypothetical protein n=1 Tax=Nocardiopsis dassonvillei TaxID=2014 RepID=UPI0036439B2B
MGAHSRRRSRVDRRRRWRPLWIAFHTGILASGVAFVVWGSVPVIEVAGRQAAYVWGVFFIVGAIISLIGTISRRWTGELAGLPLAMGGLATYAAALWLTTPEVITRVGLALLLSTLILPLWARWRDTTALANRELRAARRRAARARP